MKRANSVIVRACSWLTVHTGPLFVGLAVVWMAAAPRAAWGQSAVWLPQGATTGNIYYSGGAVGIGTARPQSTLELSGLAPAMRIGHAAGYFDSMFPFLRLLYNNQEFLHVTMDGYYGTVFNTTASAGTGNITFLPKGNVGIGTTNPQYLLSVNGTIGTKDVIVTNSGWSDYVFRPGYRLRPLSEVGSYIQKHHHLPDIPSEAEVKGKGVSLGDMQARLLAKIEELTLHMIDEHKRNDLLEQQNRELQERIARLEAKKEGLQ